MSGGHFNYSQDRTVEDFGGEWRDEEINELFADLFGDGCWGSQDRENLAHELDWWLSGDTSEKDYREAVKRFKEKWFRRTPRNRTEFYAGRLQEACERYKSELTGVWADGQLDR